MEIRRLIVVSLFVLLMTPRAFSVSFRRPRISLDGKWDFAMAVVPVEEGKPYEGPAFTGPYADSIGVPGNWNVQDKAWAASPGPGWYRRTFTIPKEWQGKEVHLVVGGVMRRAKGWVNGRPVGGHDGFDTPFRWNVTAAVLWGKRNDLTVMVDARPLPGSSLEGCMIYQAKWGGIFRSVYLEAVSTRHIEDLFVIPDVDNEKATVRIRVKGDPEPRTRIHLVVTPQGGSKRYEAGGDLSAAGDAVSIEVSMPGARLWAPDDPFLHRLTAVLETEGETVDRQSLRFGMRKIEARDGRFYLNNRPVFLRGYGNDCVYPISGSPPVDKERHLRDFGKARELGFFYVRHHSWTPPLEYIEAADEAGMLLQLELPDAYSGPEGHEELLKTELRRIIRDYRSHPSVFAYCLGNEADGPRSYLEECCEIVREMDPTRLFQSFDHYTMTPEPTDYRTTTFRQVDGPFHLATKGIEPMAKESDKPIIFHEMGNFCTFFDLSLLRRYSGFYDAYWLRDVKNAMEARGQIGLAGVMLRNSFRQQSLAHKLMIEAARASESLDGYQLWMINDFPGEGIANVGVFNDFWEFKGGTTIEKFARFNGESVLLLGGWRWNHRAGEEMIFPISLSHYGWNPIRDAKLAWSLRAGERLLDSGVVEGLSAECYGTTELATLKVRAPDVEEAVEAQLELRLQRNGEKDIVNDWPQFLFPMRSEKPFARVRASAKDSSSLLNLVGVSELSSGEEVIVAETLTESVLDALRGGGRVLLFAGSRPTRYRPSWWNQPQPLGHVIRSHPAVSGFPHDGWAGLQFYWLLEGARTLGEDGQPSGYEPIFYVINREGTTDGGLISEFQVGEGRLLVCGLNVLPHLAEDPAAVALLDGMLGYLSGNALVPSTTVLVEDLEAMGLAPLPQLTGFAGVISSAESERYPSFVGEHRMHLTRALEGCEPLVWRTKPVPKELPSSGTITFTWIGGCGYVSQPKGSFVLFCNGHRAVDLSLTLNSRKWRGEGGSALDYGVRSANAEDSSGVFSLTVPNTWLNAGQAATLKIEARASQSRRWFAVYEIE